MPKKPPALSESEMAEGLRRVRKVMEAFRREGAVWVFCSEVSDGLLRTKPWGRLAPKRVVRRVMKCAIDSRLGFLETWRSPDGIQVSLPGDADDAHTRRGDTWDGDQEVDCAHESQMPSWSEIHIAESHILVRQQMEKYRRCGVVWVFDFELLAKLQKMDRVRFARKKAVPMMKRAMDPQYGFLATWRSRHGTQVSLRARTACAMLEEARESEMTESLQILRQVMERFRSQGAVWVFDCEVVAALKKVDQKRFATMPVCNLVLERAVDQRYGFLETWRSRHGLQVSLGDVSYSPEAPDAGATTAGAEALAPPDDEPTAAPHAVGEGRETWASIATAYPSEESRDRDVWSNGCAARVSPTSHLWDRDGWETSTVTTSEDDASPEDVAPERRRPPMAVPAPRSMRVGTSDGCPRPLQERPLVAVLDPRSGRTRAAAMTDETNTSLGAVFAVVAEERGGLPSID